MNGIINIYKPSGMTSHDVVYRIRRISGIKKVGHTGTLDPDAEGVLPICIGKATRVADLLTFSDKRYTATLRLGTTTDTQDTSGKVLECRAVNLSNEQILNAISEFVGEIMQIPPMYSAIKINGRKLYELARKGIEIERKPREITIFEINVLKIDGENVEIDVKCSKGTYIRTLCHDIGQRLGCGGCMATLVRTQTSTFTVENSITLKQLENSNIEDYLMPIDEMFDYNKIDVSGENERKIINGNSVIIDGITEGECYRVYGSDGKFLCISKGLKGKLTLIKGFY